jgi:hypothetical protein
MERCHAISCDETQLIKAHIVPRAFARMHMSRNKKHNLEISLAKVKPAQLGDLIKVSSVRHATACSASMTVTSTA